MHRRSSSLHFRLFASQSTVVATLLPHIKASFFPVVNQPFQTRFYANLDYEFKHNPFATPILAHLDMLVKVGLCQLRYSPSSAIDGIHFQKFGAICFYEHQFKTIVMPSSPNAYQKIFNPASSTPPHTIYRNDDAKYLCMFLHEANHAHDFIVAKFSLNKQDAATLLASQASSDLLPQLAMPKMEIALSIRYSNPSLDDFKEAIKSDFIDLDSIASNTAHHQHATVVKFHEQLRHSLHRYPVTVLLAELKSRLIEFSSKGSLGHAFLEEYLPNTSSWYLYQHLPKCEHHISPVRKLQ